MWNLCLKSNIKNTLMKWIIPVSVFAFFYGALSLQASGDVQESALKPRVLLIGDSISMGYRKQLVEQLADVAEVVRIQGNGRGTSYGVEHLEQWLENGSYDLIHFNWGLWDLRRGGSGISLEDYEKNLRALVARLQETGAVLIWASTTPVPEGARSRHNEDVLRYNAVALTVMEENGIAINDLYAFALPRLEEIQIPRDVHYTPEGYAVLAEQVAAVIRETLNTGTAKGRSQ